MKIIKYNSNLKSAWDDFVKHAKNPHFFFMRDYMEYHSDRYEDFSLVVYDDNDKIIALLPANVKDSVFYSHGGLTFGGFITDERMKAAIMLEIFSNLKVFLAGEGIEKFVYKCMPHIYHLKPAEEDRYALFIEGARLFRRDVTATLNLKSKIKYQEQRRRAVKKATKNGLTFEQTSGFSEYWHVLTNVLETNHAAKPVHSLAEIERLAALFPGNIKLFVAKKAGEVLGGALVFENERIAHTQYLANSAEGRECGALDLVIDTLINEVYKDKDYFDFGISNENNGLYLNEGLIAQKEGFGARAVVHDFYELSISAQIGGGGGR